MVFWNRTHFQHTQSQHKALTYRKFNIIIYGIKMKCHQLCWCNLNKLCYYTKFMMEIWNIAMWNDIEAGKREWERTRCVWVRWEERNGYETDNQSLLSSKRETVDYCSENMNMNMNIEISNAPYLIGKLRHWNETEKKILTFAIKCSCLKYGHHLRLDETIHHFYQCRTSQLVTIYNYVLFSSTRAPQLPLIFFFCWLCELLNSTLS